MAVDDVYKVTISAYDGSSILQNVLHVRCKLAADPTPTNFDTFAKAWIAIWKPQASMSVSWTDWSAVQQWGPNMTIDSGKCRRLGGLQLDGTLTGQVGGSVGDMLPPQCAAVVTWNTGVAGRRKRGRSYAFGQVETSQANGKWTTSIINGWVTNLTTFGNLYVQTGGTDPTFYIGVWSERTASGCVPATAPQKGHVQVDAPHPELAFTAINQGVMRNTVYTQRRRTAGVGR